MTLGKNYKTYLFNKQVLLFNIFNILSIIVVLYFSFNTYWKAALSANGIFLSQREKHFFFVVVVITLQVRT